MSGGLEESFDLTQMDLTREKEQFWTILYQASHKNAIMGCSISVNETILFSFMYYLI
jgi:hypothetical protein